jgi:hypothetical protein
MSERVSIAVTLEIRIQEAHGSNLGRDTGCHDRGLPWFSSFLQRKFRKITSIRIRQLPSKSFSVHRSSIVLPSNATDSVLPQNIMIIEEWNTRVTHVTDTQAYAFYWKTSEYFFVLRKCYDPPISTGADHKASHSPLSHSEVTNVWS